jgi:ribosome-binding protein aMBF1 (putative translation factor)
VRQRKHQLGKSIYSQDYRTFLQLLRKTRQDAGLNQEDLARRLGRTQTFVSKCERGERRVDIVEAREFCKAIGISFQSFVLEFDKLSKRK